MRVRPIAWPQRSGHARGRWRPLDISDKPTSPRSVWSYLARAFGDRIKEIHLKTDVLAVSRQPEELSYVGFPLGAVTAQTTDIVLTCRLSDPRFHPGRAARFR